jgi:hypothetical protein
VQRYGADDEPDNEQKEPVSGQSALFACTVDADGVLLEGSAVLSAWAWATRRAMNSHGPAKTWLTGFEQDALNYGDELGKLAGSRCGDIPVESPGREQSAQVSAGADDRGGYRHAEQGTLINANPGTIPTGRKVRHIAGVVSFTKRLP